MKYRFSQPTYVNNILYDGGKDSPAVEVGGEHIPGPHWEPMDDEAKAHCAKLSVKFTGEVPDVMPALIDKLEKAQKDAAAAGNPDAIAKAMVGALIEAGVIATKKAPAKGDLV
jgi:hypothetical protein